MEGRINKLEEEMDACKLAVEKSLIMREHCPLDPYKEEMKQRCQNFSDKIAVNKDAVTAATAEFNFKMNNVEIGCNDKVKSNRLLIGRLISVLVVLGVCLVGIIGELQLNKIGNNEFKEHITSYRTNRDSDQRAFQKFLDTYTFDRDKRDTKIEALFNEQRSFNMQVMRTNSLLEQQLEVIKVKLNIEDK